MTANDAAERVQADVGAGKPVHADSLAALIAKAKRFDWVLPLVMGHDTDEARHRTHLMVMGYHVGHEGEALIDWAMRQPLPINGHHYTGH